MKLNLRKVLVTLLAALCLVSGLHIPGHAASGRISFNDPSVTVGDTVTVTMTVKGGDCALGALDATLTYDATLLEYQGSGSSGVTGGSGSIAISWWDSSGAGVESVSFSFKFKALAAGTAVIKPSSAEVSSIDYETVDLTSYGSSKVTINAVPTASSEARLSSLKVSPGSLSPSFDSDTYAYSVTVPAGTTKLTVSAKTKDDGASTSVSGTRLSVGTNTVTITVTAEDNTTKKYTITVTRPADPVEEGPDDPVVPDDPPVDDPEPLTVEIDGVTWYLDEAMDGVPLPAGFEKILFSYREREIVAAKGKEKNLLLLYLTDEAGDNGALYIYNQAGDSFLLYQEIVCAQQFFTVLPLPGDVALPEGFAESAGYTIGGETIVAYESPEQPDQILIYAMNALGESGLYSYDKTERTLQRYFAPTSIVVGPETGNPSEELAILQNEKTVLEGKLAAMEKAQSQNDQRLLILFCVAGVELVILIVVVIALCARKGGRRKTGEYQGSRSA